MSGRRWMGLVVAVAVAAQAAEALAAQPVGAASAPAEGVDAAVAARKAGHFEDAARMLDTWLQMHPQDARALHELGVLYALHGQLREAVAKFEAALAIDPESTETRRNLAELLRADQRCAVALPHYRALAGADLNDTVALRGLVLCHHALGQTDTALQACAEIQKRFAGQPFATWAREREAQIRALAQAGAVTPQQADAEGAALFAEKRYADAAVWLEKALQLQPSADRAYRWAMALLGSGEPLAALGSLQRALQLDAHHVASLSAWPTVAKAVRMQGQAGVDVAFAHQSRTPVQLVARALAEGDLVLARQVLQATLPPPVNGKAVAPRPGGQGSGAVLALLNGEVLLREGKLAQAAQAFQEALAQRPKYPPALKALAVVYAQQGRQQEARDLAGLPKPASYDLADADLARFTALRRAELMHQLQMAEDPGLKPLPALVDQLADAAPPPPPAPVVQSTPAPVPSKARSTSRAKGKARPPRKSGKK